MDTARSRVWPILVKNSLDFESPSSASVHFPVDIIRIEQSERTNRFLNFIKCSKQTVTNVFRCSIEINDWCSIGVSDAFCVAGGIIAITGSLVASFGIFPKNQARIRLYLECVGCSMVIVGVLIVLGSLKMRPRGHERQNEFLAFDSRCFTGDAHRSSIETSHKMKQLNERRFGLSAGQAALVALEARNSLIMARRNISNSRDSRLNDEINDGRKGSVKDGARRLIWNRSQFSRETAVVDDDRCETLSEMVGLERQRLTAEEQLTDLSCNWMPNDDGYGDDHQAAIETGLSTVLTVSTLVSFRADHHNPEICCLHHAVQNRMSAQRWLKRLRMSRYRLASTNNNQSSSQLTETTLIENYSPIKNPEVATSSTKTDSE